MYKRLRSFLLISLLTLFLLIPNASTPSGENVIGPKISISTSLRDEEEIEVEYNPIEKNFLVTWIDRLWGTDEIESRVRGKILHPNGTVGAARTYMTRYGLYGLLLQHDIQHNRYLMVWELAATEYRLLGPSGRVKKTGQFPPAFSQALTYYPLTQEYLYAEPLRRFSNSGKSLKAVSNPDMSSAILLPDSESTNYFFFYSQLKNFTFTIYYQVLRSDGTPIANARPVLRDWSDFSVAFNPSRREFLLVSGSPFRHWWVTRVSENGKRVGNPIILAKDFDVWSNAIFYDDRFFVAYNEANRIFVRELDMNAQPQGRPLAITEESAFSLDFEFVRGEGRNFVLVWREEPSDNPETRGDLLDVSFVFRELQISEFDTAKVECYF